MLTSILTSLPTTSTTSLSSSQAMEEVKFEEQMMMEDDSFINMLHSGSEEDTFLFCPLSSPSSCYSSKPHMLCFDAKEFLQLDAMHATNTIAQHHKSSDSSSMSSLSSSPPSTNTKPITTKKKGSVSTASVSASKKPRTVSSASHGTVKVRKEKLGERILTLQQLVSPFGKSDTASVLHEALGYIRFLHDQVQVLSSPYLQGLPTSGHQNDVRGQYSDLRSRGLCLVPIACTEHVASSNGADLWSPAMTMGSSNNNNSCSSTSKP